MVKPSRTLLALVGGMCCGIVFSGAMIGLNQAGNLALWSRITVGGSIILIAFLSFYRIAASRKAYRLDISGQGQIRLSECLPQAGLHDDDKSNELCGAKLMQLSADSTLWPMLLLLRLQSEGLQIVVLPVLPDSVTANEFRALSVACRWIAAHDNSAERRLQ